MLRRYIIPPSKASVSSIPRIFLVESFISLTSGYPLKQVFEFCKRRIGLLRPMAAVSFIQVFAAFGTKSFAIRFADRADGDFEKRVFAQDGSQIDVCVLRENESRVCFGAFVEGV